MSFFPLKVGKSAGERERERARGWREMLCLTGFMFRSFLLYSVRTLPVGGSLCSKTARLRVEIILLPP